MDMGLSKLQETVRDREALQFMEMQRAGHSLATEHQQQQLLRSAWDAVLLYSGVLECPLGGSQLTSSKLLPPSHMISRHCILLSHCPPLVIFNLLLYFSRNILEKILRLTSFLFPLCFINSGALFQAFGLLFLWISTIIPAYRHHQFNPH